MKYRVVIKKWEDDSVIRECKWTTNKREVERMDDGYNINLNHDLFYTSIEESEDSLNEVSS